MCEVRLFQSELMAKYEIMVLICQVGPFNLKLIQINLGAQIHWWEPETWHETQRWELERHITRVKSNNIHILYSLSLHYSMRYKKSVRKSDFHSGTKSYSVECLCYHWNAIGNSSPLYFSVIQVWLLFKTKYHSVEWLCYCNANGRGFTPKLG